MPINLPDDRGGCTAIAFALPSLIRKWAGTIREVALDSTFNTNKAGFECFSLLGEVFGSGLPVGFLLIKTSNPEPNLKEKYIRAYARHFVEDWNIRVKQCLTDKDITEINALLAELPDDVKYQICFWHSLRIIKGRLCVLARRPAPYDVQEAFSEFDWIALDFVPIAQLDPELRTADRLQVAQNAIPTIKLRFAGQTSEVSAPPRPKLIINLNRTQTDPSGDRLDQVLGSVEGLEQLLDSFDDETTDNLGDDLDAVDRFDGPASWFENGETVFAEDKNYVFCPAVHRQQILRIFMRHFCEHPLLPDRNGLNRSLKQIRYDAVFEMYKFCEQRGLREVWGYMWTAWYCPAKYKLWARASQPDFIGRWRTTMAVENFWRNLKHGTLHHLLHPRLDQLVYLIATEVLPSFEAKMQLFDPEFLKGRSKALTPFQRQFKKGWKVLAGRSLGTREYKTDVSRWTSVHPPDPNFFRQVIRRRTIPFYHHPLLKPKDGSTIDPIEDGSISDGDVVELVSTAASNSTAAPRGVKRKRAGTVAAEASSSRGTGAIDDPFELSGSSSPIRPDEYEDEEDDAVQDFIKARIIELEKGVHILKQQLGNSDKSSKIWLRAMKRKNIGNDVAQMASDVRHISSTGTVRHTTWARPGKSASTRYTGNTMGYTK
ncbi:SWIM-type domain-containing protein [Favolaschia claudopus]|uniref:SWIM-type domain-containing protein n=1 Tax=Favolaschia claudopus TaxID=2862362 RepID=A0AAV9Z7P4_9AGAR